MSFASELMRVINSTQHSMRTSRASLEKAIPDDPDRISPTIFWTVACRMLAWVQVTWGCQRCCLRMGGHWKISESHDLVALALRRDRIPSNSSRQDEHRQRETVALAITVLECEIRKGLKYVPFGSDRSSFPRKKSAFWTENFKAESMVLKQTSGIGTT